MNNWLLFALLTVVVFVNVYFTYRKTEGIDDKGRMILALSQLSYLVFIALIFLLGKIFNILGFGKSGAPMALYIGSIAIVAVVLAGFLFLKHKFEKKVREEHKL